MPLQPTTLQAIERIFDALDYTPRLTHPEEQPSLGQLVWGGTTTEGRSAVERGRCVVRIVRKVSRPWMALTGTGPRGHMMYDKTGGKILASLAHWTRTDDESQVCLERRLE